MEGKWTPACRSPRTPGAGSRGGTVVESTTPGHRSRTKNSWKASQPLGVPTRVHTLLFDMAALVPDQRQSLRDLAEDLRGLFGPKQVPGIAQPKNISGMTTDSVATYGTYRRKAPPFISSTTPASVYMTVSRSGKSTTPTSRDHRRCCRWR